MKADFDTCAVFDCVLDGSATLGCVRISCHHSCSKRALLAVVRLKTTHGFLTLTLSHGRPFILLCPRVVIFIHLLAKLESQTCKSGATGSVGRLHSSCFYSTHISVVDKQYFHFTECLQRRADGFPPLVFSRANTWETTWQSPDATSERFMWTSRTCAGLLSYAATTNHSLKSHPTKSTPSHFCLIFRVLEITSEISLAGGE